MKIPATDALPPRPSLVNASRFRRLQQAAWRSLWFVIVPAVLSGIYMGFAVPVPSAAHTAMGEFLARAGSEQPVSFAVGLGLLFALLVRYWRSYLPGAKWLATVGDLARLLREPRRRQAIERRISPESGTRLTSALQRLDAEIAAGDLAAAVATERTVRALAAPVLWQREWLRGSQVVVAAGFAAVLALFLRTSVFSPVRVLSSSMLPGLAPGDLLLADRLAYGALRLGAGHTSVEKMPGRGDVIVFQAPEAADTSDLLVKRVIGLPGDRIEMHGSRPVINGWEVPSCDAGFYLYVLAEGAVSARLLIEFLEERAYLTIAAPPSRDFPESYIVKPGEVFVLGDNRNNSSDSRAWNSGLGSGAPLERIEGRARWFLLGARRDRRADVGRLLESVDGTRLALEGLDVTALKEGIATCLANWPKDTSAPEPSVAAPPSPAPSKRNFAGE